MDSASDSIDSPNKPNVPSKGTFAPRPEGFPGLPEGWRAHWETFASSDARLQLFGVEYRREKPTESGAGVCAFVVHGFGEHGGRYQHFPHFLQGAADSVYCMDLRGHGRSEGLRGHVEDFEQHVEDLAHAIQRLHSREHKRQGHSRIHLVAQGLGGLVAIRALHFHPGLPLASVTLSSPMLGLGQELSFRRRLAAQALAHVWSGCHLSTGIDPQLLSRDARVVEAYERDRLVHGKITPHFYSELGSAMGDTLRHCKDLQTPLLMLVPMSDQLARPELAIEYFNQLQFKDRQIRMYRGFYHELFHESGKEKPFEELRKWLKTHNRSRD